ncbi:transposase, partial [Falsiroseomonas sp.]|uniref:transposase n=1 Tax=Falsiroseomonas sp. TaxID=2870721 RepID=UPI00356943DE
MSEGVKRRRSFPEAFKLEAVAAIRGGRSVSQVAAELGLPDRLVRSWLVGREQPGSLRNSWGFRPAEVFAFARLLSGAG